MIMTAIITVIAAYLIGSVSFAVIFSAVFIKKDVRNLGSGNAGTTNMMRVAGFLPGALTFICDALKGFVACYIGKLIFEYAYAQTESIWLHSSVGVYLCGLACMLGHMYPIFFGFKGGKGVLVGVASFLPIDPRVFFALLIVFIVIFAITKYVSISSILGAALSPIAICLMSIMVDGEKFGRSLLYLLLCLPMAAMVVYMHRSNMERLMNGTESKFTFKFNK